MAGTIGRAQDTPPTLAGFTPTAVTSSSVTPPAHDTSPLQTSAVDGNQAATFAPVNLPPASSVSVLAAPDAVPPHLALMPTVVTPADSGGGVAYVSTAEGGAMLTVSSGSSSASLPVDQLHYADYGWHIVPSAENQYGEAAPADDAWHQFAADFIPQDWFYT